MDATDPVDVQSLMREQQVFPLRAYNAVIMWLGCLMMIVVGLGAGWGLAEERNFIVGIVLGLFSIGGGLAFLRLLSRNKNYYEVTDQSISFIVPGKPPRTIAWGDVRNLRLEYIPSQAGYTWNFVIEASESSKIEIDGDVPRFRLLFSLIQLHLSANGKQELVTSMIKKYEASSGKKVKQTASKAAH